MDLNERMARAEDYVFGLMDEEQRRRAERDMEVDAEFRACVLALAERLRALNREKRPAMSDTVWNEVSARIAQMPQMAAAGGVARPALAAGAGASDPDPKGALPPAVRPYAHQFGGWRGAFAAACLIVAMTIGYLAGLTSAPAPPSAVAVLADEGGAPGAIVEVFGDGALRVLPLVAFDAPQGKVLQLWTVDDGGAIPLAVLEGSGAARLRAPDLPAPRPGRVYEITLEDAPGASPGRPGGPVLVSGAAVAPPG